jgi:hypothetical protein
MARRPLEELEVWAGGPATVGPELFAGFVVGEEEDVALEDALGGECAEAGVDQLAAEAAVAEFGNDGEVMEVAAAAVVAAENGGDDSLLRANNETQARIARQVCGKLFGSVGFIEANALGR